MKLLSLETRKQILLRHPRVKFVPGRNVCDGYRWSQVPLKALFADMRGYDPVLKEKYRCKNAAHYDFTALKARNEWDIVADSGVYCWSHLMSQLDHMNEWSHFVRWWDKQPEIIEWRNAHAEG